MSYKYIERVIVGGAAGPAIVDWLDDQEGIVWMRAAVARRRDPGLIVRAIQAACHAGADLSGLRVHPSTTEPPEDLDAAEPGGTPGLIGPAAGPWVGYPFDFEGPDDDD